MSIEKRVHQLDNTTLVNWYYNGTTRHANAALQVIRLRGIKVKERQQMESVVSRATGPTSGLTGRKKATKLLKDRISFLLSTDEGKGAFNLLSDDYKTLMVKAGADFASSKALLRQLQGAVEQFERLCGFRGPVMAPAIKTGKSHRNAAKKAAQKGGYSPKGPSRTARRMGTGVAGVRAGSR